MLAQGALRESELAPVPTPLPPAPDQCLSLSSAPPELCLLPTGYQDVLGHPVRDGPQHQLSPCPKSHHLLPMRHQLSWLCCSLPRQPGSGALQ